MAVATEESFGIEIPQLILIEISYKSIAVVPLEIERLICLS
jgi:hypothetical protein